MSERTFFTLRYALPGYTFILMSILVAYPKLEEILFQTENATLVAALAFFSLLSGAALGFLVSQVWYVIYNHFIFGRYGKLVGLSEFLRQKYRLTEDRHRQKVFYDYIHRLSHNKETLNYTQRRYDLMHLCGSTLVTTLIGSFFGLSIRSDLFRTNTSFKEAIESLSSISIAIPEMTMYDLGVILTVTSLLVLLFLSLRHACKEYAMAVDFSVREVVNSRIFPYTKARRVFTDDYFSNEGT